MWERALDSDPNDAPVSTCLLIDDYAADPKPPKYVLPNIVEATEKAGLQLDYIVRESGLVELGGALIELGRAFVDRTAPRPLPRYLAVRESSYRHSISTQVELWNDTQLACALLASVWQLVRLGAVDAGLGEPALWEDLTLSRRWRNVPAVIRMSPEAPPLVADRTISVLPSKLLMVEHAVMTILGHIAPEQRDRIDYIFTQEW
ncbi:hypothetical protein [Actinomadura welshii]|uniref:hypothetical protein n=1 Tax=Actinomadura welshii TaxID=3103817 RepID=UPI000401A62D|nr:hypothetical protein [Actinomadura madurae]